MRTKIDGDTVAEAARVIGCSKAWVYTLVGKGRLRVLVRGQPRDGGKFAGAGMLLDREDVAREAAARR